MLAVSQDIVINFHRARILGIFVGPPILYQHCPLHNLTRRRGPRLKLKLTHFAPALLIHSPIFLVDLLKLPNVFVQFAKLFKKLHTLHSSSISTNDCSLLMRLIFVQIAECICFNWKNVFFNLQNYSNNQHTLLLLHPPIIVPPISSANILRWLKSFLLLKKIQILCQRSKFYALFWPAWTLEWVMMSRQTWWACFYNNSNIGKNKVTPW